MHPSARPKIESISRLRVDAQSGLRKLYDLSNDNPPGHLLFLSKVEVADLLAWSKKELDNQFTLSLLAEIEAILRTDFQTRATSKSPSYLSSHFRTIARKRKGRVRLVEDILDGWRLVNKDSGAVIGRVKTAFHLRNWLAHGRYFVPNLGRKHDFFEIETLAIAVQQMVSEEFPI
jgi:hypothetical protein